MSDRPWRTKPEKPGRVKIVRPDSDTGEVIETTVTEATVKARARRARVAERHDRLGITGAERHKILAGEAKSVDRDELVEGVEKGYEVVLLWLRPWRFSEPVVWVKVTEIAERNAGGWTYLLDVTDTRHRSLLLKRGSGYTTDRDAAIDDAEAALDPADYARISAEARQFHAERKERDREHQRRQERAVRERLHAALENLGPTEQQALLAGIQRLIGEASDNDSAAA